MINTLLTLITRVANYNSEFDFNDTYLLKNTGYKDKHILYQDLNTLQEEGKIRIDYEEKDNGFKARKIRLLNYLTNEEILEQAQHTQITNISLTNKIGWEEIKLNDGSIKYLDTKKKVENMSDGEKILTIARTVYKTENQATRDLIISIVLKNSNKPKIKEEETVENDYWKRVKDWEQRTGFKFSDKKDIASLPTQEENKENIKNIATDYCIQEIRLDTNVIIATDKIQQQLFYFNNINLKQQFSNMSVAEGVAIWEIMYADSNTSTQALSIVRELIKNYTKIEE